MKYLIFIIFSTIITLVVWLRFGLDVVSKNYSVSPEVFNLMAPLDGDIDVTFLKSLEN